jgi:ArsR family transcriptional regulator, arsenate/arsenite/antimonite-responsive transcriptional repressor
MKPAEVILGLSALAQESRLMLFRLLVKRGPDGYTPTHLMEQLGVPAPTLSFHLKELLRAGLIKARRDGRFLFYSPNFLHMNQLLEFLTDNCCSLADNNCGPACDVAVKEVVRPKRMRA